MTLCEYILCTKGRFMTRDNKYNLFLISEGLTGGIRRPIITYISKDYDTAKLYFKDWIKDKQKPERFYLLKIGEFDKDLKMKPMKVFVSGGLEELYRREKTKDLRQEKERILNAYRAGRTAEQIKILFNGEYVNENRNIKID